MITKQLLKNIEDNFSNRLQAKTGWGRNDVMEQYRAAVTDEVLTALDHFAKPPTVVGPVGDIPIDGAFKPGQLRAIDPDNIPWKP